MAGEAQRAGIVSALASDPELVSAGLTENGNGHAGEAPAGNINIDPDAARVMVALPFPDGPRYDVMRPNDLGMRSSEQYRRLWARVIEIGASEGEGPYGLLSEAQEAEITELETRMCIIAVPDAPVAEIRALDERRRANLLQAFLEGMGVTRQTRAVMTRAAQLQANRTASSASAGAPPPALGKKANPPRARSRKKSGPTTA